MNIVYFGYNSFLQHKRGVENVIDFQSTACDFEKIYYLHWGSRTSVYKIGKFICISIKHCWYWPLLLNVILVHLRRKNKFIIHSHNPLFSFCSISKTNILTVHDGLYYLSKSKKNRLAIILGIIEQLVYFRCEMLHFISNYTKNQTLFGKRKNFVIIPNTSHFEPLVSVLKSTQKNSSIINILIVRSIEDRARIDLVLQVAELLKDDQYMFTIAGKGPLLTYYQKEIIAKKLTNVEMLGYVDDTSLLQLYADCDLVMMPAEYGEGFGLPIIEGYLFNKPVIASNRCAIPEIIISKDYLFENTKESIQIAIKSYMTNKSFYFKQYYDSHFSNSLILSKFRQLYCN